MFQAIVSTIILVGLYKLIDSKKPEAERPKIDIWMVFSFVFAPGMFTFAVAMAISSLELPQHYLYGTYLLYFLVPLALCKVFLGYNPAQAFRYAVLVPGVVVAVERGFALLG